MKNKTHSLPKSIRPAKRYFEFTNSCDVKKLKKYFLEFYGIMKLAESDFTIKLLNNKQIIKINRDFEKELILCVENYNKKYNENIKIIKKSGTIKSLVK